VKTGTSLSVLALANLIDLGRRLVEFIQMQGLPGDGCDRTGAHKRPQNDPWGVVNSARKKIAS
jgi:hypothetical protein